MNRCGYRRLAGIWLVVLLALAAVTWGQEPEAAVDPTPAEEEVSSGEPRVLPFGGFRSLHKEKSVEEWLEDLQSANEDVRVKAMRCLACYGEEATKAVPTLRTQLASESPRIQRQSLAAIVLIEEARFKSKLSRKSEKEWLAALRSDADPVQAAYALRSVGTDASLPSLSRALGHEDPVVCYFAARAISRRIESARWGKDDLSGADKKREVLAVWRRQADICMPALIELSKSENMALAGLAVGVLGRFGFPYRSDIATPAVPPIVAVLERGDKRLKQQAAGALGKIGEAAGDAVPALVACALEGERRMAGAQVSDRSSEVSANHLRRACIWALGRMGSKAKDATPLIIRALGDKDDGIRKVAVSALTQIAVDEEAVPILAENLADTDPVVCSSSAWALAEARSGFPAAVPALIEALADPDFRVRFGAAGALRDQAQHAHGALAALRQCLNDEHPHVRVIAKEALAAIAARAAGQ